MTGTVLVVNAGSSSLKYQVLDPESGKRSATGLIERIGEGTAHVVHTVGSSTTEREMVVADHREALQAALSLFDEQGPPLDGAGLVAVGHRVVMGGRRFAEAALIDDEVVAFIEELSPLAPLHNPPNLAGIHVAREVFPELAHVAVFDTAFFRDLPAAAATYALDRAVAEAEGIRRYGAHGTSHRYVSQRAAELVGRPCADLRQVVLHLGNGASASAVAHGRPVDTSMGFTPLEGLVMGTRTGDIDPAVVLHLIRHAGMTVDEVDDLLNRRSGMRGLTGHNDMREVHRMIAAGDDAAREGLDVYVHRLKKYIGAYAAVMGGIDVLAFTAGVGEHDQVVRAGVVAGLGVLGLELDPLRNEVSSTEPRFISPEGAEVSVVVVPTDEELAIAQEAMALVAP